MFPILQLGPLAVQTPGLILLVGLWLALALTEREAKRLSLNAEALYNVVLIGLLAGVVGARLAYAARSFSAYVSHPLDLFSLNPAALAPTEGALIGVVAALLYGARKHLPLRPTLDALAPGLAVFMLAFAGAHLASGDAFGASARLPWSIYLWDDYRHPAQVYELLSAALVLAAWRWARDAWPAPGLNFLWVVALSSAARLFLEAFRGDSVIWPGGWRAAQVGALAVLGLCLWLMHRWAMVTGLNGFIGRSEQSDSSVD
jgi:phosphatidylglycerol:prolipoprotein diacylglycerol transferase